MENYLLNLALAVILAACLYTDLKERKIYNKIILAGMIAGLAFNFFILGMEGIPFSMKGFALGIALLFLPFAAGGIGAGDVKLLAIVGIFKGAEFVFSVFILSALAGGLFALAVLLGQKRLLITLCSLGRSLKLLVWSGFKINPLTSPNTSSHTINIPYAPAIVTGTLVTFFLGTGSIPTITW